MSVFSHVSLNTQNIKTHFLFWTSDYNLSQSFLGVQNMTSCSEN